MKQDFETPEQKTELARSLGFGLKSLERLDGAAALNFKAVCASDGMTFAAYLVIGDMPRAAADWQKYVDRGIRQAYCGSFHQHYGIVAAEKA